jgi:hypothetical protein
MAVNSNARILEAHSHSTSKFSLSSLSEVQSRLSLLFSSSWRASVVPYYVTTHPPAIQKQH